MKTNEGSQKRGYGQWGKRIAIASVSLALWGCGAPWKVVKQANPNPLAGQTEFVLEPISFEGIEAEKEHVEGITKVYAEEVKDNAGKFTFKDSGAEDAVIIRSKVTRLEKGFSGGLISSDSEIDLTVQILRGEEVLDEFTLKAEANQNDAPTVGGIPTGGYGDGQRLEWCAEELGEDVASYLKKRTKG